MSHKSHPREMDLPEVLALLDLFEAHGITVIIDGGWGVDALLEKQTRPHEDLDIAVDHSYVPLLRSLLEARGYHDVPRDDTRECNFVLGDDKGHEIDVHSFIFDEKGNVTFGVPYPFESLQGHGTIGGRAIRCIPPDWMIQFHTGYKLDENDYRDVLALCQKFNLPLPKEHELLFADKNKS
jgi:lincosamide nucleotidyltransferase A/C/D/E